MSSVSPIKEGVYLLPYYQRSRAGSSGKGFLLLHLCWKLLRWPWYVQIWSSQQMSSMAATVTLHPSFCSHVCVTGVQHTCYPQIRLFAIRPVNKSQIKQKKIRKRSHPVWGGSVGQKMASVLAATDLETHTHTQICIFSSGCRTDLCRCTFPRNLQSKPVWDNMLS